MDEILVLIVDMSYTHGDKEYWMSCSDVIFRKEAEIQGRYYSLDEFQDSLNIGSPPTESQIARFIDERITKKP
jgi:hypothetical protein